MIKFASEQTCFPNAEGSVLLVDESNLNDVLASPIGSGIEGLIVLLNDSTSTNQDAEAWNPEGSGSMWKNLNIPIQAVRGADAVQLTSLAQQNSLQAGIISV